MIEINLAWIFLIVFMFVLAFLLHNGFNIHLFVKKDIHAKDCDTDVMQDLIMKYPLVDKDFMGKTAKEMNIENNQEIQEHNIKFEEILNKLEVLQRDMDEVRRIQRGGL